MQLMQIRQKITRADVIQDPNLKLGRRRKNENRSLGRIGK
uniref:Uncharacterized protein n=1 Tax=Arundo donax TaxID=35708 RepID=A0A0A9FMZ1_ARUDO